MKARIWRALRNFVASILVLITLSFIGIIAFGGSVNIGDDPLMAKLDGEGPHVFFSDEQMQVNYIRGDRQSGFHIDSRAYALDQTVRAEVHFPLDNSRFELSLHSQIVPPPVEYKTEQKIIAISDVEGGFKGFRDFLLAHKVINDCLCWAFGKGHLVLVGDFVDRGFSTTQVLWLIYKLEQEARDAGGMVHFILGNHEIKNLQGNFQKAAFKYFYVAGALGKRQDELYGPDSLLGRWLASKNTLERINNTLFVHGGIHPYLAEMDFTLQQVNDIVRANYSKVYVPGVNDGHQEFLLSTENGPSWYRGYFSGDLSVEEVERGLNKFSADTAVVGHTMKWRVSKMYDGRVYAIDVQQPRDYRAQIPSGSSQGLLIENGVYYRLLDDGERQAL